MGSNNIKFNSLIPELSVKDIKESKNFYINILGFKLEYEREEDKFAFLSYGNSQIMIEEINNHWSVGNLEYPFGRGINFQIETSEIERISTILREMGVDIYKDIFISKYRVNDILYTEKELLVMDPNGYLLRFQETKME